MVKRIGTIASLLLILVAMTTSFSFAASEELTIEKQYPTDGATGTAVENVSVKVWFNQDVKPKNDSVRASNKKAVKLLDPKGKEVPIYIAYNPREEGQVMILGTSKAKIKGDTTYTLKIDSSFQSTSGATLSVPDKVSFTTLNQSRNMTINMAMMGVMMVGMVFFTIRSTKKQQEKENASKGKTEAFNPYKEAKRTGKSIEEVIAKEKKNKERLAAAAAKKAGKDAESGDNEEEDSSAYKRVAGPRPISAAGSTYKPPKKKSEKKSNKGTTNPKNQTGKQKNKKKK